MPNLKVANYILFLYILQWQETKEAKIKIANNLRDEHRSVKLLLAKINVYRVTRWDKSGMLLTTHLVRDLLL